MGVWYFRVITRGNHVPVTVVCQATSAEVFGSCTNACTFASPCPQTSPVVGSGIKKSQGAVRTVEGERCEHTARADALSFRMSRGAVARRQLLSSGAISGVWKGCARSVRPLREW
jgi:hypothetical protein